MPIGKTCSCCFNSNKPGVMDGGAFVCDDCLNSPRRTRPWLFAKKEAGPGKPSGEHVAFNRLVVRDDGEDGPIVGIPSDSSAPVSEADILRAKEEQAKDPRKYTPTDERTLARIGATLVGENANEAESIKKPDADKPGTGDKEVKAIVKGARKSARSAKRPGTRKPKARRSNKVS
jgi:hypothetical protein